MARVKTLYESVESRARIVKQGEIVCIIIDGGGAMVAATQDFMAAQKWASSRTASGNDITDRGRFLEQIPAVVARPGSISGTRGSDKLVEGIAKNMKQAGYDLAEWQLPPELKNLGHAPKEDKPKKPKPDAPVEEKEA